jgi:TonB family protein
MAEGWAPIALGVFAVRGRQARRAQGGGWSRWLTASVLLHLALLGLLAALPLVGPVSLETLPASLRVRLLPESPQPPAPSQPVGRVTAAPAPAPPVRNPHIAAMPPQGHPLMQGERPAEASPGLPSDPPAEAGGASSASIEPVPESDGGGVQGRPDGPAGGGPVRSAFPQEGAAVAPADSPPAAPPEASAPALTLLQAGGASGAGWSGQGAADLGSGRGGGGAGGAGFAGPGKGVPGGTGGSSAGGAGTGLAARGGGTGSGAGATLAASLQVIRRQIEQAKRYPEAARRDGLQGTVSLRFRIAPDGSVEAMEILRSSGSRILDEASMQTIQRAAPYPPVAGWIRLPLSYRLDP